MKGKGYLPYGIVRFGVRLSLFIAAGAMLLPVGGGPAAAGTLTISGSSTVKPIVEAAAGPFKSANPGTQVIIGGGGSSGGVKNAGSGKVDIGMASRAVKDKEKAKYTDLVTVPVGQDGVAIVVNKQNTVEAISREQVLALFTGQTENWSEVGGMSAPVAPVGILLHHGTSSVFMKYVGLEAEEGGEGATKTIRYWKKSGDKAAFAEAKGADGNQPACAAVMTNPGAISFASIGFAQSLADKGAPIKLLKLEGVAPTSANVVSGAYTLSRPLQVMTKNAPTGLAKKFIDYLLSPEGQRIVVDKGYIAVR